MGKRIDLLLHLGFPKSGSSTLQFGLFKKLQEINKVKLFTWRQYDESEPHTRRPSSCLFTGKPILEEYLRFEPEILNILSDESFTAPTRLRKNNFGSDLRHPFTFPKQIKDQIERRYRNVHFHCLVVIRKQADLMFSQFVEEYNLLKFKGINLLFDKNDSIDTDGYDVYNFSKYINILNNVFGHENVTVLLYEDLANKQLDFYSGLSKCLNVPLSEIETILKSSKYNVKKKSEKGYYTKDNELIRFLTTNQKLTISEYFREDNLELMHYKGLEGKIEKYDYIE